MAVQQVSSPALAPSSQEGGNMVATNTGGMALPGSEPITPMPETPNLLDPNLPMPHLGAELPLTPTNGKYGAVGLPSAPGQADSAFTTGVQPGGNQGRGGGAGSSGPDLWKPTVSSA